jgi:aldose 1-epimerase
MLPPSGDQFEIAGGGYRAVVTESGGALRALERDGVALVDGFAEEETSYGGRGQQLVPWPNRLRDGRYSFDGEDLQLALTEPSRHNASHGLVRWAAWTLEEHTERSVALTYRLMAQTGYPWTLDLRVVYDVSADGLTVTQSATNLADRRAPYASGSHPYLTVGPGPVDGWELTLPAETHLLVDDRLLPVGREPVDGTPYDFRMARPVRGLALDDGFTDLVCDEDGVATVVVTNPASGRSVSLWVDGQHRWLQAFTADGVPRGARRSIAVEPMTSAPDAFRSGDDLVVLSPSGEPGDEFSATWGIRALD